MINQIPWTAATPPIDPSIKHSIIQTSRRIPSVQEQMGVDPISRLAKAIDRLAAAIEAGDGGGGS